MLSLFDLSSSYYTKLDELTLSLVVARSSAKKGLRQAINLSPG
jgi:hypothetical protein